MKKKRTHNNNENKRKWKIELRIFEVFENPNTTADANKNIFNIL